MNQPSSMPRSRPAVTGFSPASAAAFSASVWSWRSGEPPISRILSKIALASASIWSVSAST